MQSVLLFGVIFEFIVLFLKVLSLIDLWLALFVFNNSFFLFVKLLFLSFCSLSFFVLLIVLYLLSIFLYFLFL